MHLEGADGLIAIVPVEADLRKGRLVSGKGGKKDYFGSIMKQSGKPAKKIPLLRQSEAPNIRRSVTRGLDEMSAPKREGACSLNKKLIFPSVRNRHRGPSASKIKERVLARRPKACYLERVVRRPKKTGL